jgi:hypothetical protein
MATSWCDPARGLLRRGHQSLAGEHLRGSVGSSAGSGKRELRAVRRRRAADQSHRSGGAARAEADRRVCFPGPRCVECSSTSTPIVIVTCHSPSCARAGAHEPVSLRAALQAKYGAVAPSRRIGGHESPGGGVPTEPLCARLGIVLQASRGGGAVRPVRSLDPAAAASLRAKRWRNGLWRRYPDQWFWFHLGLTRLYHLRRDFIREFAARRRAGNRPVERSAGNPHATFVRGTEASS